MLKRYVCILLLPLLLQAQTLSMRQNLEDNQRIFHYQFKTAQQEIGLQFSLDPTRIQHNSNLLQVYVPAMLHQQLWQELQRQASQAGPYRLIPGPGGDRQNFQLQHSHVAASSQATMENTEQLHQSLQQFSRQYQQKNMTSQGYQQLLLADNRQLIMVDHLKIMQQSLQDISALTQNVVKQLDTSDERQLIATLLQWIQLIPNHPAEQREYGQSFAPPLKVLRQHQGDSASKAVLLATLLRSALPNLQQAFLYLPERTMLALATPAGADDLTVTLQGTVYLVADPTSAALSPPGQVAKLQKVYILNQFFAYRQF